ncbi:hypothetical protein BACCAC_00093 [Bacteroides caccae ATCC 43185]|nr:hypothetical protein BACCAC_00093 [Bacteroides caccae ATCC 43185]
MKIKSTKYGVLSIKSSVEKGKYEYKESVYG